MTTTARAAACLTVDLDGASMLLDEVLDDRKAEARSGALSPRREEGFEDAVELGCLNPHAVVLDLDLQMRSWP